MSKNPFALLFALLLSCWASNAAAAEKLQVLALMSDDAVSEALTATEELKQAVESALGSFLAGAGCGSASRSTV